MSEARQEADEFRRSDSRKADLIALQENQLSILQSELSESRGTFESNHLAVMEMKADLTATKEILAEKTLLCQDLLEEQVKLKSDFKHMVHENDILVEENSSDKEKISELTDELDVKDRSTDHLRQELEMKDSQFKVAMETVKHHEHDLVCREADVKSLETRMETARFNHDNQVFQLEGELKQVKVLYQQVSQKCDVYSGEMTGMNKVISDYVTQVEQLTEQCETTKQELDNKRSELADLREMYGEKVGSLEGALEDVTRKASGLDVVKCELEKERNSLLTEVGLLKEKVRLIEAGEVSLKELHERELSRLQHDLINQDASLKDTRQRVIELDKALRDNQDDLSAQITKYHKDVGALTSGLDLNKDELDRANRKVISLESELESSLSREAGLSKNMANCQEKHRQVEQALTSDLKTVQRMFDAKDTELEDLNENMLGQIDHLLKQKHEVLMSRDELVILVDSLQDELDKVGVVMEKQEKQLKKVMWRESFEEATFA